MYGFINQCLEQLIVRNFGQNTWQAVIKDVHLAAGSNRTESSSFCSRATYPDNLTYDLLDAAERALNIPKSAILEQLGKFYVEYLNERGYGRLISNLGATLRDFLQNLDFVHDHMQQIFPDMRAPSFSCIALNKFDTILHYRSMRSDYLHPMVIGQVKAIAKVFFNQSVNVTVKQLKGEPALGGIDHVQFLIQELPDDTTSIDADVLFKTTDDADGVDPSPTSVKDFAFPTVTDRALISQEVLCRALPLHLIFDRDMNVVEYGDALARIFQQNSLENSMTDLFTLRRPRIKFTFDAIAQHMNALYVLQVQQKVINHAVTLSEPQTIPAIHRKPAQMQPPPIDILVSEYGTRPASSAEDSDVPDFQIHDHTPKKRTKAQAATTSSPLRLRGQMFQLPSSPDLMLFCSSPNVSSLTELATSAPLFVNDIPLHDTSRDICLANEEFRQRYAATKQLENQSEILSEGNEILQRESEKVDQLLYNTLPAYYADALKRGLTPPAQRFEMVSLLIVSISGFSKYCSEQQHQQLHQRNTGIAFDAAANIVGLVNKLVELVDTIIAERWRGYYNNVFRVQIATDSSVTVVGGFGLADHASHARAVARYALDLLEAADNFEWPILHSSGESLHLQIGIHSGEIVAGCTAYTPRKLVVTGSAVQTAQRIMATGTPSSCSVSQDTFNLLHQAEVSDTMALDYRDSIKIKGRPGPMKVYYLSQIASKTEPV